jgi:hypothetical protein
VPSDKGERTIMNEHCKGPPDPDNIAGPVDPAIHI